MIVPFLDLKRQYFSIKEEIDNAIQDVLNNQSFILGEKVEEFEEEFANYLGVNNVISLGSGTDAVKLAVKVLKLSGSVITTSNTFVSTVDALTNNNIKPIFADVSEDSFNIDITTAKIKEGTTAILPVHLYGQISDMKKIKEFSEDNSLKIIEDSCQAHGTNIRGKKAGTFGEVGCFSFYPAKNLGGYGDSGAISTNNDELADKLKMMRNYGSNKKYYHSFVGHNSRMDEIQASVLIVKLKYLDRWNELRRNAAQIYNKLLKNTFQVKTPKEINGEHTYYTYVIKTENRNQLQRFLSEKNISTLIHYPIPVHKQQAYKQYNNLSLPITEKLSNEILSLPMFPEIKQKEIKYVCESINEFYSE